MPELLLPRLKREIEARLAELRPLVEEAIQLEAAKTALLEDIVAMPARRSTLEPPARLEQPARLEPPLRREPVERVAPVMPRGSLLRSSPLLPGELRTDGGAPRKGPANGRVSRRVQEADGEGSGFTDRDVVLALVEERPGVSAAEIVAVTKIPKPTVASLVAKLKREGVLVDEAGGVRLASREPITLAKVSAVVARANGASDAEWDAARPAKKSRS